MSSEPSAVHAYEPTPTARLNYLRYLMSEPAMDQAVEALAALDEVQRRALVAYLQRVHPGERLALRPGEPILTSKD